MANPILDTLAFPFRALGRALGSLFAKGRNPDDPANSPGAKFFGQLLQGFGWFGTGPGGWSQDRTLQVQQFRGWVYCAVRAIAEEIAGQPIQVAYRRDPEQAQEDRADGKAGRYIPKWSRVRTKALARLQSHEELELVPHTHPLRRLLDNPNPPDTHESFWQKLEINIELTGNGYIWALPNQLGYPMELWPRPSHWVWPAPRTPEQIEAGVLVSGYEIRPYGVRAGSGVVIPAEEIIHIALPHALTPLDGFSPLAAGAPWIDTLNAIDSSRYSAMKQGIWPGLIITLLADVMDPDQPTLDRINERFAQKYQGHDRMGRPLILGPGMDIKQATRPPAEMDFVGGSDQLRDWVLSLFRVPKAVLGITAEVNKASMEAASANFARWCVKPRLRLIDGILTEKLARRFDENLVVFHEDPTPDDPTQLNADLTLDLQYGVRTYNEVRAVRGLEPYPHGGDDPLVPTTLAVVPYGTGDAGASAGGPGGLDALDALFAQLRRPTGGADEGSGEEEGQGDGDSSGDSSGTDAGDGANEGDDKTRDRLRRRGTTLPEPSRNGHGGHP